MLGHQRITCLLIAMSTDFYHLKMLLQMSGISYFRKKVGELKKQTPEKKWR